MSDLVPTVLRYGVGDVQFISTLYYGQPNVDTLRAMAPASVHCVVTSPPYWGLRDYGTGTWEGGDPDCVHAQGLPGAGRADGLVDDRGQRNRDGISALTRTECVCGARKVDLQIGLEETPEAYVASMVSVFREVWRVLRDDGTLWLNLGDSYASRGGRGEQGSTSQRRGRSNVAAQTRANGTAPPQGLKAKDLVGIPWMVAFALRADGWYLRSDIIWAKGNPMPESVTDRPTRSHEYLFLLTKSDRYFYDSDAIREESVTSDPRKPHGRGQATVGGRPASGHRDDDNTRNGDPSYRNKRSVWVINPKPYRGAHFATFPPALVEPCIRAGTSEKGCCPVCGSQWGQLPLGWGPTCGCPPQDPVPCVVMDPFSGAGTLGFVANREGRNYVGLDLNPDYLPLAEARILGLDPPEVLVAEDQEPPRNNVLDLFGGDDE